MEKSKRFFREKKMLDIDSDFEDSCRKHGEKKNSNVFNVEN